MTRALAIVEQYCFADAKAHVLGRCRIAFYLWLFVYYWPLVETFGSQNISAFADVGTVFWYPLPLFRILAVPVLPHPWIDVVAAVWKLALLTSCLGLWSRWSMTTAFVLGIYVLGLPVNFGTVFHFGAAVVLALGLMALSRAGDACSMDAWWRQRRGLPAAVASGEYRWPIRFIQILLATIYFCAGVSKWQASGLGYLNPDVMASFLHQRSFAWYQQPLTDWGYAFADIWWLCSAMSLWILVAETFFWTALFSRRAALILIPGMFVSHIGIAALLGPQFFQFLSLYVFLVPWTLTRKNA